MKFTIFAINDKRAHLCLPLHDRLCNIGWKPFVNHNVNGTVDSELDRHFDKYGYENNFLSGRVGHFGIWFTVLNSFEHAPHVTFEDDAVLGHNFQLNWNVRIKQLPKDADFFSLFLPRDSDHLYNEDRSVSRCLTKTYQHYGGVSMYYTVQGVEKIKSLLARDGFTQQYDNTLYTYAADGELNGYCSKPSLTDLVYITGTEESIVQNTDFIHGDLFDFEEENAGKC